MLSRARPVNPDRSTHWRENQWFVFVLLTLILDPKMKEEFKTTSENSALLIARWWNCQINLEFLDIFTNKLEVLLHLSSHVPSLPLCDCTGDLNCNLTQVSQDSAVLTSAPSVDTSVPSLSSISYPSLSPPPSCSLTTGLWRSTGWGRFVSSRITRSCFRLRTWTRRLGRRRASGPSAPAANRAATTAKPKAAGTVTGRSCLTLPSKSGNWSQTQLWVQIQTCF